MINRSPLPLASRPLDSDQLPTLFESIGGSAAIDRLVEAFYARMDSLPEARTIRAMHADDLRGIKHILKIYLTEWMGGPNAYSSVRGHPRLRARHLGVSIGIAERDAWMLCMRGALDEVVADPDLKVEITNAFANLADWMRNRPDG